VEATTDSLLMRVDLPREIPEPVWPEGVQVRGFCTSDAARLHALLEHGYRNGGGGVAPFEVWLPALVGDAEFDPARASWWSPGMSSPRPRSAGRVRS
jgi:hypothetical protein